ncbi:MAG: hypothetical protein A2Z45_10390 [Chloroflexi bacterium RBG_19FT_COMBO_55_16]|nr:MAG: hypothetical protein A2Z45_10390 [Chloroflexi bacterium RBG_19FT_COMBO_55_16]
MKKLKKSFPLLLMIFLIGGFLLAACSQSAPTTQTEAQRTGGGGETPLAVITEAPAKPSSPTQTQPGDLPTATAESYPAPEAQGPVATYTPFPYPEPGAGSPPPVKEGLEASDPATVQLASGKPQLVEFFAFW